MKTYKVTIKTGKETFNGYTSYSTELYRVEARNEKSAINKALKISIPAGRLSQSIWVESIKCEYE